MAERYKVVPESASAHCCFEATVLDMEKPQYASDGRTLIGHDQVCECFELADAEMIAAALNAKAA